MEFTENARRRLRRLTARVRTSGGGLRFAGVVGSCRGAMPLLRPADGPQEAETASEVEGIRFFVPAAYRSVFDQATLDFEAGLFGRGWTLTWPHHEGCACQGE